MITVVLVIAALGVGIAIGVRRERAKPSVEPPVAPTVDEQPVIPEVREALDSLSVGVVVASPTGDIVFRNGMARGLTGAVHSDVLVEEAIDVHLRGALDGQTRRQLLDLFGPPRKVVAVSATPLAAGGAVAMVEDITERHLLDAVRTDFVSNISHELKTPVGALAVLAEALSAEDDIEVIHRLSGKMVDEALRVGRTIDDLLELSRAGRTALAPVLYPRRRPDSVGTVVVVRDTSGSVDSTLVAKFNAHVRDMVADINCEVVLLDADAAVQAEYRIAAGDEVPDRAEGGGGTDFGPAFARVRELIADGERIAGVVYLTDLCGTFPSWDEVGESPVLWIATTDLTAPLGRTVRIDER